MATLQEIKNKLKFKPNDQPNVTSSLPKIKEETTDNDIL